MTASAHKDRAWACRVDLGRAPYDTVWALQRHLVERRIAGLVPDVLLVLEHEPAVTLGRKVRPGQTREGLAGVPTFEVERGGDLTYHGPGQLVVYPILALPEPRRDVVRYLRDLEEGILRTLRHFGLDGARRDGLTGAWVGERKVASLGVAVRQWVTYHGLSLNVTAEPEHAFTRLSPCGLPGAVMSSMESLAGHPFALGPVADVLCAHLADLLEMALVPAPIEALLG